MIMIVVFVRPTVVVRSLQRQSQTTCAVDALLEFRIGNEAVDLRFEKHRFDPQSHSYTPAVMLTCPSSRTVNDHFNSPGSSMPSSVVQGYLHFFVPMTLPQERKPPSLPR